MSWSLAAIAGLVLAFASIKRRVSGTPLTAPIFFTAGGLALGLVAAREIDVTASSETVRILAEVTLGLVLFSDASRVDVSLLRREIAVPARLLALGLPMTIGLGFVIALLVFGDFLWTEALLLAIILAPTDAALGQAVVSLPSLPTRVRQGLNVESGLNDGICVPLLLIVLGVAGAETGVVGGGAVAQLVAEQIGYGIVAGLLAGTVGAVIILRCGLTGSTESMWSNIVPVAAAALAYSLAVPLGGSGFIAAFIGGLTFGTRLRRAGESRSPMIEELGDLFSGITFVVFGAILLATALGEISWRAVVYALLSLTVVRMVPVALALLGTHARRQTVGFIGWFGPRGLASIVFVILIVEEPGKLPHEDLLLTTAVIAVGLSVLAHGLTASPLANRYAAWFKGHPRPETLRLENL